MCGAPQQPGQKPGQSEPTEFDHRAAASNCRQIAEIAIAEGSGRPTVQAGCNGGSHVATLFLGRWSKAGNGTPRGVAHKGRIPDNEDLGMFG